MDAKDSSKDKKLSILLVRHGESEMNVAQGRSETNEDFRCINQDPNLIDPSITERGRNQVSYKCPNLIANLL